MRPRITTCLGAATLLAGLACSPPAPESSEADSVFFPPTNRPDVRGTAGAVVSDHPLASAAGYQVLQEGGNAMDAAVAMAGVLAVVRPHMNGIGGDAFALIYDGDTGTVHALNGSGRAGTGATPDLFAGMEEFPQLGALSVSVPGTVAAWSDALERFGTRPLGDLLQPAIRYARDGFPVSTRLAADFEAQGRSLNEPGLALYLPGGSAPPAGSLLRNPPLAETLARIAAEGAAGFYQGPVAQALTDFLEAGGGHLRMEDFASHTSTWVDPLTSDYLEHTFYVMPPNSQGLTQGQMLGMARWFDFNALGHNTSSYLHTLVEIKKVAFADRQRWVADPEFTPLPVDELLAPNYLEGRAGLVSMNEARASFQSGIGAGEGAEEAASGDDRGDTVYLTVVDRWGNAVSWIQSLYSGFGSGLLEPGTGVMLQNRAALFTLEEGHPNQVAPGKRPFHTLTPMMALRDGALAFTLGTPGGDSQPQSLLQIVHNMLLFGMTPQAAVEAPRFRSQTGLTLLLEDRIPPAVRAQLQDLGHETRVIPGWTATFGGAQMIRVDPESGTLTAAADPRREAYAIAY